jgi:ubiquinone/menaquinone biosynthesis C-methylase UbiE
MQIIPRILDVGCGTDTTFKAAPRGQVNCDVDRPTASIPNFVRCDARNLPFTDESFDYISMYNILEHIVDYKSALTEALRVATHGVVVRVDGFLTMRNLLTFDHKYTTMGMRFIPTSSFLIKIRTSRILDPRERSRSGAYRLAYLIMKVGFKVVMVARYLSFPRSWHHYLVKEDNFRKVGSDFLEKLGK